MSSNPAFDSPELGGYPESRNDLKLYDDRGNPAHDDHYDVINSVPGGIHKTRVTPEGDVIDGETQIGRRRLGW
jgi:hypothetical protein